VLICRVSDDSLKIGFEYHPGDEAILSPFASLFQQPIKLLKGKVSTWVRITSRTSAATPESYQALQTVFVGVEVFNVP